MKIGITCYPTYGGSGVVATELGKSLAQRGHQIHFISYSLPARLDNFIGNVFYHEVEMSQYPLFDFPLYTDSLASKMVDVAKYHDLDILHVHYAIPHATSAFIAKQILAPTKDIKVITTLHGTNVTLVGLEPSFLPLVKFSIEQSDYVTSVSKFLQMKTNTMYNTNKEIQVIPNFVDTARFQREKDCQFKMRIALNGEKILVHISNFRPVKRVPDVIRIFDVVRKAVPTKLVLVGDGRPVAQGQSAVGGLDGRRFCPDIFEVTGVPRRGFYALRHTFQTVAEALRLSAVQSIMGHAPSGTICRPDTAKGSKIPGRWPLWIMFRVAFSDTK